MAMTETITRPDIENYIARVQASGVLGQGTQRRDLLRYLVETEHAGRGDTLKAYTVGVDALGKPEHFDPARDSSVRVAVGRLRSALALFEASNHADTVLEVDIPVGTYRPDLKLREQNEQTKAQAPSAASARPHRLIAAVAAFVALLIGIAGYGLWTSQSTDNVVVLEIDRFKGEAPLVDDVTIVMRRALARNQSISVASDFDPNVVLKETDLVLRGSVARRGEGFVVALELSEVDGDAIVWATSKQFEDTPEFSAKVAEVLGNELRVRIFGASKAYLSKRDPATLSPEQLFIMATWVPGPAVNAVEWELERTELMGLALEKAPDFGAAHSVMADKLAYLANVYGPSNQQDLREAALRHAQQARELAPLNPDVMFNVAQAYWHSGAISEAEAAMNRVLDLDPGHDLARFLARMIPFTCETPTPEIINWAERFDATLSPDNPIRWLTLTWIGWLYSNDGQYEKALEYEEQAALIFQIPYTFMRHAMLLHQVGRTDDAANLIRSQSNNWPDIDASHFAEVTYPRLCQQSEDAPGLVALYTDLATAMQNRP